ncbi:MAG TPA: hypothetical protein VEW93_07445 [Acidimicrobiales bacterium]|nr:hypothetical protein [Acidimicrobiales bacterium]
MGRAGMWRRVLVVAVLVGACSGGEAGTAERPGRTAGPGERAGDEGPFDAYGGSTAVDLEATGWFRTEEVGGRWWLVTPDGHPFWSAGVNGVRPTGTTDRDGGTPYAEAVAAAYGSDEAWADAQVARFQDWGVTTLGGWGEEALPLFAERVPSTYVLDLARDVDDEGRFAWADLWDEGWADGARAEIARVTAAHRDDPWLVGWFTDNEMPWGMGISGEGLVTMFDLDLARPPGSPGKEALLAFLRHRYGDDLSRLAADFPALNATTWDELATPRDPVLLATTQGGKDTQVAYATAVAERYFSVVGPALAEADPHHLDLGVRFVAVATPRPVLEVAARSVDVVSVNFYEMTPSFDQAVIDLSDGIPLAGTRDTLAGFGAAGKPVLVSEFGYRAADAGLPNTSPAIFTTLPTQAERARALRNYGRCLLDTSYVVGAHWFLHADQPAIGRADGEDQNLGLVDIEDRPYEEVTTVLAGLHDEAYARLSPTADPLPCTPVGTQATPG